MAVGSSHGGNLRCGLRELQGWRLLLCGCLADGVLIAVFHDMYGRPIHQAMGLTLQQRSSP